MGGKQMFVNQMKRKLKEGKPVTGVVIQEAMTSITEMLGLLGFDYLFIDCEHSSIHPSGVAQLIMAAELRGLTPLVRPPKNEPECMLNYLDAGAQGIIVPGLSSVQDAKRVIEGVKYPPAGERGLAGVRSADYGLKGPLGEYVKVANEETMALGVLENMEGVSNIDSILSTEGLDAIFIGTNDLSRSLGYPGQTSHPKVLEAIDVVLKAGEKAGKPIGGVVRGGETAKQYFDKGFKFVLASVIGIVAAGGKQFLSTIPK
jgi:4-hydroxy-2-oxoheptanedioate aldolase